MGDSEHVKLEKQSHANDTTTDQNGNEDVGLALEVTLKGLFSIFSPSGGTWEITWSTWICKMGSSDVRDDAFTCNTACAILLRSRGEVMVLELPNLRSFFILI